MLLNDFGKEGLYRKKFQQNSKVTQTKSQDHLSKKSIIWKAKSHCAAIRSAF